jgi:dienelactone hydrolase
MPMNALLIVLGLMSAGGQAPPATPRIVTITGADEVTLKATYHAAARPGPGVLLLHDCNRERSAWSGLAAAAAARGYHVLALDYRGYGESAGQRLQNPQEQQQLIDTKWPVDIDAAFAWLIAQQGVDRARIAAAGASCGVNQAVHLARRHPEVRTVVLLSGPVNAAGRAHLKSAAWMPILAAASHDDGDAAATMRWVLDWSRNPANKLVEYKTAGHGTDMLPAEKSLQPAILDWLDAHLRDASLTRAAPPASKPTIVEQFWETLEQPGGVARARQIYVDAKRRTPDAVLFPEGEMNLAGYRLLQAGNAKDAAVVFELNVEAYPRSANTYDSLADAYLALEKRDEALRNAEKALALLPSDTRIPEQFREAIRASAQKKVDELRRR